MNGTAPANTGRTPALTSLLLWLLFCGLSLWSLRANIGPMDFRDPDDAMRLAQVRDFLNGQSWFDVTQHRVLPPHGGPMHWSRLVDLPIAALIAIFTPLAGTAMAERIACIAVPLLLLGGLCVMLHRILQQLIGRGMTSPLGVALLLTSLPIVIQYMPLRIDHHGWQILMGAVTLFGALHSDVRRGGFIAGLGAAFWLHVSSEGLPYAVMFGGLFGLRYLFDRSEWSRLQIYMVVLAAGSALLLLGTHGWAASLVTHCDAMSPPFLVPLIAAATVLVTGKQVAGDATTPRRLLHLCCAAAPAGVAFLILGKSCLAGPFETLDPIVYRYWYLEVAEGRPLWEQGIVMEGVVILPALLAILASAWAWLSTVKASDRTLWACMLLLQLGALVVAILVTRAMAIAYLYSIPANVWLLARLYTRVKASPSAPRRVLATLGLALLTPVGLAMLWTAVTPAEAQPPAPKGPGCTSGQALTPLSALPAATIFAPLDMGPAILVRGKHSVIGTAHHRNVEGIALVLRGFMSPPDKARDIVRSTGSTMLVFCGSLSEMRKTAKDAPRGLANALEHGQVPGWLQPVPSSGPVRIYRVR